MPTADEDLDERGSHSIVRKGNLFLIRLRGWEEGF